ncbi:mRNA interferase YafQ [Fundidesulfovibrio magnetotacticus]|uniref:mRNA interferase YafQ n=1 Tax=Fundidesulfovibrio magnetotacticus TaxID=2730080 RepID=A0A6V8LQX3_9BACT|nr:type II toxin-antitoxin system YafQ family toxin [Fundidesulfovibrio magnetotacticus]GFK93390.1 mRNA interferase YafQ [Fundidesulfovibrio magnetotacticus]
MARRGKPVAKLDAVILLLEAGDPLPAHFKDHALTGSWKGFRDLHIEPDWILIYAVDQDEVILTRTGTHADLFR